MNDKRVLRAGTDPNYFVAGAICGIVGTLCYILAISLPAPPTISFLLALAWPILSILFAFAVYKYISIKHQSIYNQLSFIFITIAFVLVSIMISIQVVVKTGMQDSISTAVGEKQENLELIANSMRWVDLGVDLAWDLYLGIALIFLALAILRHPKFGRWWSIPLAVLAIALVLLNMLTFPYPPDTKGVLDVGPLIGIFIIVFGARMLYLGVQLKKSSDI